jgi:UDP-N-acetylmuramoyl-L-alanyl-D-glutamate--2,6-diaminopimelate ligase
LANVLAALRKITPGKLIAVFGAGGDRDHTKRPRMGAAAAKYADKIILTSDNPRSEPPLEIIAQIAAGIPPGFAVEAICDRQKALQKAVEIAQADDIVLVAGKGHENYQETAGVRIHFDDREVLNSIFREL